MEKRILVVFLLCLFGLFAFAGEALAAEKSSKYIKTSTVLPLDGGEPLPYYHPYSGYTPVTYEGKLVSCFDIEPDPGVVVIQHDKWGTTYYDYQKNGSVGRMIAVGPGGHRSMSFHETRGPYGAQFPRFVTYNCKDPLDVWCRDSTGYQIYGGSMINAGYSNNGVMHDGREVIIYHATGTLAFGQATVLSIGDPGYICSDSNLFVLKYDLPDSLAATDLGMWPKMTIQQDTTYAKADTIDYIHVVMTEGKTTGGDQRLGYMRCYLLPDNNLFCEWPYDVNNPTDPYCGEAPGFVVITPGVKLVPNKKVAHFAECEADGVPPDEYPNTISVIASASPVSKKVTIQFTNKRESGSSQVNNDVFYTESKRNGNDWFPQYGGTWPPTEANGMLVNVTNYPPGNGPRAYTDLSCCIDYNDSVHIVWNAHFFDSTAGTVTYRADLYHWSQEHGISKMASGPEDGIDPGGWNRTISKMSISAKDPIYHPDGEPDSVYLFCIWSQFNEDDNSAANFTNSEIYAAASNDGGGLWTKAKNLTGTHAPGCDSGECVSEHWSSLAENMYDGDLHIEYVCDRDAGGIVQDEGVWTENPMMYMHVQQLAVEDFCGISHELVDPPSWCDPPLKVVPGESRTITMKLTGLYTIEGYYEVTTDNANVYPTLNGSGILYPQEEIPVELAIDCYEEGFLTVRVFITSCDGVQEDMILLHVVQSEDYYECPRDPRTWIVKDNCKLKAKFWANCEEWVWDKRFVDTDGDTIQPIFTGSPIVATTWEQDTVVGRDDYSDQRTGARDTINVVESSIPHPDAPIDEEYCIIQKVHVKNTFICANNLPPPNHQRWWWIDIHKQIIMYHDRYPDECPNWKKEQIIKYVWITKSQPPAWWPAPGEQAYDPICFGYFADVDAPFDTGCYVDEERQSGCNLAGYTDAPDYIMWQSGWDVVPPGPNEDYYVGLALTDKNGNAVAPLSARNVLNQDYLYPQGGWGWNEGELYELACTTSGVYADSMTQPNGSHDRDLYADRSWVLTTDKIPAGTEPFDSEFILIEAFIPDGFGALVDHIQATRATLIPELDYMGVFDRTFPRCGDAFVDGKVNISDRVYLDMWLFTPGSPPPPWPYNRADVNNDGRINVSDVVYYDNYLFVEGSPPPNCTGFGRQ